MKKLLLLVAMIVLIPACTHYYVKPGQTSASFDRDKRECQRIAEKEATHKGTRICDECEKCLLAKGWRGNSRHLRMPVHNRLGITMQPGKRRMNRPQLGQRRHA